MMVCMSITLLLCTVQEHICHDACGLFLQLHLRVAVSTLQERSIGMACQFSDSLLVHTMMEQG